MYYKCMEMINNIGEFHFNVTGNDGDLLKKIIVDHQSIISVTFTSILYRRGCEVRGGGQ